MREVPDRDSDTYKMFAAIHANRHLFSVERVNEAFQKARQRSQERSTMRKTLAGSLRIGNVCSSHGDGYVSLEVEDKNSDIEFLRIKIPYETWGRLVAGNSHHEVDLEVVGLEQLGKKRETIDAVVKIPTELYNSITEGDWNDRKEKIADYVDANHSLPGWTNSRYFGSQTSVSSDYKTGMTTLRFSRTRWVDVE